MEKRIGGKKALPLIFIIMTILLPMALCFCDFKTGQYQFDSEIDDLDIDSLLESISGGQHSVIAGEQSGATNSGQSGTTADGHSVSEDSGQPDTIAGEQPAFSNSRQPGAEAGEQPAFSNSRQPGAEADEQLVSASGGQPSTAADEQSVPVISVQSNTAADGQSVFPQVTQDENEKTAVQSQPVAVRVIPPVPDTMTMIRGGEFYMSNPLTDDGEEEDEGSIENEPKRLVTVNSFYVGKYEVTQREYEEVMRTNPSHFKGPNRPVENINWFDAVEYCNRLSLRVGLTPAYTITGKGKNRVVTWDQDAEGYRLPTSAEWEYACRAGTTTPFNTGSKITRNMANYWASGTKAVGSYAPNDWGLYDMHGNVAEWCWDLFGDYDSEVSEEIHRVFRGGNWLNTSMRLRSGFRDHFYPNHRNPGIGLRIVRNTF